MTTLENIHRAATDVPQLKANAIKFTYLLKCKTGWFVYHWWV